MPPGTRSAVLNLLGWWSATDGSLDSNSVGVALLDLLPALAVLYLGVKGGTERWLVLVSPKCPDDQWARVLTVVPEAAVLESQGEWDDSGMDYMIFGRQELDRSPD